jgi:hypothetical protein
MKFGRRPQFVLKMEDKLKLFENGRQKNYKKDITTKSIKN